MDVDNLHTRADRTSEYMLLVYRLGRAATILDTYLLSHHPRPIQLCLRTKPCLLGDQWTVITGYQATYEAAVAIKDKLYKDEFNNVVLAVRWISPGSQLRQGHL